MSFLNTKVSLENLKDSFFIKNGKNFVISCEQEDIEILKQDDDVDNFSENITEIYENISNNNLVILALSAMECLIQDQDEYTVVLNTDIEKEEYNNTINGKDEKDPEYAAALENDNVNNDKWVEYWNYIKGVFEKIHYSSILLFKNINIFLSKNVKEISLWYNENGDKYKDEIVNSELTMLTLKLPNLPFDLFLKEIHEGKIHFLKNINFIYDKIYTFINTEMKEGDFNQLKSIVSELKENMMKCSFKELNKKLYKDNVIESVSSKQFFEKFDFSNLNSFSQYDDCLKKCESVLRISITSSERVKLISSSIIKDEYKDELKKIMLDCARMLNSFLTTHVWLVSQNMYFTKIAFKFCKKVIKNS